MSEVIFPYIEAGVYVPLLLVLTGLYVLIKGTGAWVALKKSMSGSVGFMTRLRDYVAEGDLENAASLCGRTDKAYAETIGAGVACIGDPILEVEDSMTKETEVQVGKFGRRFRTFPILAIFSALAGLFGSFLGMMMVFFEESQNGAVATVACLSEKLCYAMFSGVFGIGLAILILIFYIFLNCQKGKYEKKLRGFAESFVEMLNAPA